MIKVGADRSPSCVPKKMTWNFATIQEMMDIGKYYGYHIPDGIHVDYKKFKKNP